jgi:hypothetical protein
MGVAYKVRKKGVGLRCAKSVLSVKRCLGGQSTPLFTQGEGLLSVCYHTYYTYYPYYAVCRLPTLSPSWPGTGWFYLSIYNIYIILSERAYGKHLRGAQASACGCVKSVKSAKRGVACHAP